MKLNYFAGFAALALVGCVTAKRGEIVAVRDLPSPDGRYVCTVFGETFHDTTGYKQHVDLRRVGEERDYPGNVYVVPVGDDVKVWWASPTNLTVGLHFETQRNFPANTNICGVAVIFSEMNR
ncbi:MAG: hypothetical protein ACREFE_18555 [Limisphaerales bacterium]